MTNGTTAWTDFAVRPNTTSPEGQVPVSGSITTCPDIIPMAEPVSDPQGTYSTPASWSTDYPNQVNLGAPNYIYVRAKNFAPGAQTGTISLYAVGASLINFPNQWLNNPLSVQATGATTVALSAQTNGQIVVGDQPFYWDAPQPPPGSDHFCMFSLVDTKTTPNPLLHSDVPNNYNTMADLVTNKLYVGWKNIAEVSSDVPTWTHSMKQQIPPGAQANQQLHIYAFGTAGLVNGQVAVSSGDSQGFDPPIDIPQTTIESSEATYGMITTPQPGVASTILNVSFWKGSSSPGFSDRITIVAGWVPPSEEEARPYIGAGVARRLPKEVADNAEGGWEIAIGAMHYQFSG